MTMQLDDLNALDADTAARELRRCCGSSRWAARMTAARPFASVEMMALVADVIWAALDRADWLEAFAAHPRIGGDSPASGGSGGSGSDRTDGSSAPARRAKAAGEAMGTADQSAWSAEEQARVADAAQDVRERLAQRNREYEARFGYIFIVCATGRSASEMLGLLESRLAHDSDTELHIAAHEQRRITRLRLEKLLQAAQDTTS
jgi:OHCU decarboxylase